MQALREAAKQALEALDAIREADMAGATPKMVMKARSMYEPTITALRAALAQGQAESKPLPCPTPKTCQQHCCGGWCGPRAAPVQEPVAKVELMTTGGNAGLATRIVEIDNHLRERLRPGQLLYTGPSKTE